MTDVFVGRCGCKLRDAAVYPGDSQFLDEIPTVTCKCGWDHTVYVQSVDDTIDATTYRDVMWKPTPGTPERAAYDKAWPE